MIIIYKAKIAKANNTFSSFNRNEFISYKTTEAS